MTIVTVSLAQSVVVVWKMLSVVEDTLYCCMSHDMYNLVSGLFRMDTSHATLECYYSNNIVYTSQGD